MSNLIEMLQSCTEERQDAILLNKREYHRAARDMEAHWEAFRSSLSQQQLQQLDDLLSQESTIQRLEEEAAFEAALALGMELGRL